MNCLYCGKVIAKGQKYRRTKRGSRHAECREKELQMFDRGLGRITARELLIRLGAESHIVTELVTRYDHATPYGVHKFSVVLVPKGLLEHKETK